MKEAAVDPKALGPKGLLQRVTHARNEHLLERAASPPAVLPAACEAEASRGDNDRLGLGCG